MTNLREQYSFLKKLSVWFDKSSVIVLTMGKVGTLTICNSLDELKIKHVHPHSLRYTRPGVHFLKNVKMGLFKSSYYAYKTLTKRIKVFLWLSLSKEVTIITGVRDPFSRAISAFFEQSHYLGIDPKAMSYEEMYEAFEKHYDLEGGLLWFDNEIGKVFHIDIFKAPFNRDKGYQIVKQGKFKIFIYRIDYLDKLEEELKEFIANKHFKIASANETVASNNYIELKNNKKYSNNEFKSIEGSKYMKHFYTDKEVAELKDKWVKQS